MGASFFVGVSWFKTKSFFWHSALILRSLKFLGMGIHLAYKEPVFLLEQRQLNRGVCGLEARRYTN